MRNMLWTWILNQMYSKMFLSLMIHNLLSKVSNFILLSKVSMLSYRSYRSYRSSLFYIFLFVGVCLLLQVYAK